MARDPEIVGGQPSEEARTRAGSRALPARPLPPELRSTLGEKLRQTIQSALAILSDEKTDALLVDRSPATATARQALVTQLEGQLHARFIPLFTELHTAEKRIENPGQAKEATALIRMAIREQSLLHAGLYGSAGMHEKREEWLARYVMWSLNPAQTPSVNLARIFEKPGAEREIDKSTGAITSTITGIGTTTIRGMPPGSCESFGAAYAALPPHERQRILEVSFAGAGAALQIGDMERANKYRDLLRTFHKLEQKAGAVPAESDNWREVQILLLESKIFQRSNAPEAAIAIAGKALGLASALNETTTDKRFTALALSAGAQDLAVRAGMVKEEFEQRSAMTHVRAKMEAQVALFRAANPEVSNPESPAAMKLQVFRRELVGAQLQEIAAHVLSSDSKTAENVLIPRLIQHYAADHPQLGSRVEALLAPYRYGNKWDDKAKAGWRNFAAEWNRSSLTEYVVFSGAGMLAGAFAGARVGAATGNPYAAAGLTVLGGVAGGFLLGAAHAAVGWNRIADGFQTGMSGNPGGLMAWVDTVAVLSDVIPVVSTASKLVKPGVRAIVKGAVQEEVERLTKEFAKRSAQHGAETEAGQTVLEITKEGFEELLKNSNAKSALQKTYGSLTKNVVGELRDRLMHGNVPAEELTGILQRAASQAAKEEGLIAGATTLANIGLMAVTITKDLQKIGDSPLTPEEKAKAYETAAKEILKNVAAMVLWGKVSDKLQNKLSRTPDGPTGGGMRPGHGLGSGDSPHTGGEPSLLARFSVWSDQILQNAGAARERLEALGVFGRGNEPRPAVGGMLYSGVDITLIGPLFGSDISRVLTVLREPSAVKDLAHVALADAVLGTRVVINLFRHLQERTQGRQRQQVDELNSDVAREMRLVDVANDRNPSVLLDNGRRRPTYQVPSDTDAGWAQRLHDRVKTISVEQFADLLSIFDGPQRDIAARVLHMASNVTGAGGMENLARHLPRPAEGKLYTPGRGSLADSIAYQADKGLTGKPLGTTGRIDEATHIILDEVTLRELEQNREFRATVLKRNIEIVDPVGHELGLDLTAVSNVNELFDRLHTIVEKLDEGSGQPLTNIQIARALSQPKYDRLRKLDADGALEWRKLQVLHEKERLNELIGYLSEFNPPFAERILEIVYPKGAPAVELPIDRIHAAGMMPEVIKQMQQAAAERRRAQDLGTARDISELMAEIRQRSIPPSLEFLVVQERAVTNPHAQTPRQIAKDFSTNVNLNPEQAEAIRNRMINDGFPENAVDLARDFVANEGRIVSNHELGEVFRKQHAKIQDLAKQKGIDQKNILYVIPKPGKSYDQMAMLYRQANGVDPDKIVSGAQLSDQLSKLDPAERKKMMVVVVDDFTGSGDSLRKVHTELRSGVEYKESHEGQTVTMNRITDSRRPGAEIPENDLIRRRGTPFEGEIVLAPATYTANAAGSLGGKPGAPESAVVGDPHTTFLPSEGVGIPLTSVLESEYFRRLSTEQQRVLRSMIGNLGFGRGGTMVIFEHGTPNNNVWMFTEYFAPYLARSKKAVDFSMSRRTDSDERVKIIRRALGYPDN